MAKKNIVHLVGFVNEIISEDKTMFSLQIRKNENKYIYPIIELSNETYAVKDKIEVGSIVCIEGKVTTAPKEMKYPCPSCEREIHNKYIFTTISASKVLVMHPATEEPFLNKVILLGTVCKEKEFKYIRGTKSPVANTKYQIAVNRKEPNSTDYPWVSTFARQAEEDAKRIDIGSQILVDGVINTRMNTKECACTNCGGVIEVKEPHTEVLGTTIEYLNNCIFEQ